MISQEVLTDPVREEHEQSSCLGICMNEPHVGVDVGMSRVAPSPSIPIDPFQPMLRPMSRCQILQVVRGRYALTLRSPQEVPRDGIGVVAEGHLDWTFKAVDVSVVAGTLVCLMFLH